MKKSKFWPRFLIGFFLILLAITFLILAGNEEEYESTVATFITFAIVFLIVGILFFIEVGSCIGEGNPRDYLLDRMEYKKHDEFRSKDADDEHVRLLLSEADKKNSFRPSVRFHSIERDSLVSKEGVVLNE